MKINPLFGEGGLLRVRSLLAFALVGSTVYALLTQGLEISAPLFVLTTSVVKDYFGVRDSK